MDEDLTHYALFVVHKRGFSMRLHDEGVEPGVDALWLYLNGRWGFRRYDQIKSINLQSGGGFGNPVIANCHITFNDGSFLQILNVNEWGSGDIERNAPHMAFVRDLHQRLVGGGYAGQIAFTSGLSRLREAIFVTAMLAGVGLFIILPFVLWVLIRNSEPFFLLLTGIGLLWPLYKGYQLNRPATYDPAHPPDLFF